MHTSGAGADVTRAAPGPGAAARPSGAIRGQALVGLPSRTQRTEKTPAATDVRKLLLTDLLSRRAPLAVINICIAGLSACVFAGHAAAWVVGGWLGYFLVIQGFRLYVA